jgi:hypothetical protein
VVIRGPWWLALACLASGCAQIVGIEQESFLVDGGQQASSANGPTTQDSAAEKGTSAETAPPAGEGPWCPNGLCDWSEDAESCPGDCPKFACGNHSCEAGEDVSSCAADCGEPAVCGDTVCDNALGERSYNCADDCAAVDGGGD